MTNEEMRSALTILKTTRRVVMTSKRVGAKGKKEMTDALDIATKCIQDRLELREGLEELGDV